MGRAEDLNSNSKKGRRDRRGNRLIEWVLLTGNRLAVAGILLGLILVGMLILEGLGVTVVHGPTALFYLFGGFIGGNLTLITIVLSINQLVLSRQFQAPGDLRSQLQDMTEYRQEVADLSNHPVMPVFPPEFLHQLLQSTQQRIRELEDSVSGSSNEQVHDEVRMLTTRLSEDIDQVTALLKSSGESPFHALSAMLNTYFGLHVQKARRIQAVHRADLAGPGQEALDSLIHHLRLLDIAREYFKTLFTQKELAYLSRILLYVGIPTELVATIVILWSAGGGNVPGPSTISPVVIPLTVTISFAPLAVLFSFVVRIAVIAERTVSILPFTTPEEIP